MERFLMGNQEDGFWVGLGHDQPVITQSGEFSAVFTDPDTGEQESVFGWRAKEVTEGLESITLDGDIDLPRLRAKVAVRVTYDVINSNLVQKEISFTSNTPLLCSITARLTATREPENYWTFEQASHPGGPIYEIYPAMGMKIDGRVYGYLTDSGYRNRWTRVNRQTDGHGFLIGIDTQPDAELMMLAAAEERNHGLHYVQYKFGEYLDFSEETYDTLSLGPDAGWQSLSAGANLQILDDSIHVAGTEGAERGLVLPVVLHKNELYEVYFEYRSMHPLSLRLLDANSDTYFEWAKELGAYRDQIVSTEGSEWKSFAKRFFSSKFPDTHQSTILKLMQDPTLDAPFDIEVRNVEIRRYHGSARQFHPLVPGEPHSIRLFVFDEPSDRHRDIQIASQVRLAEGLGFEGSTAEKMLYADNQMLVWIAQHDKMEPHVVPSLNYQPDMYLRDTFWEASAVFDKEVAVGCWQRYAATQHVDGQLDTLARSYNYAPSVDDNDSTMFFIMWAYINWKRYGAEPQMEPLKKALESIRSLHCPNRDGRYISRTAGWFDTIWGEPGVTAINQGHFAVVLQCARELGMDVTDTEVVAAKKAYRDLYDTTLGYVRWSSAQDYLSPSVLMGEFMNLWLFNEPILSDEAVISTVEKLPVIKRGVPCIADKDAKLFTDDNKPWESKYTWRQGVYHNGGSWFLYEYLAYVAAARHGWDLAQERMDWRLEMEFSKEDEPYAHEFIPLTDDEDDWWPTCRVFGWTTFAIVANQVAAGASELTLKNPVTRRSTVHGVLK